MPRRSCCRGPASVPDWTMTDENPRAIIAGMCREFYSLGWVSGTGGGISLRRGDIVYMAPSGVEKEKIRPEDVFVIDMLGNVREPAANPALRLSECAPLFLSAYELRGAGAVLHSHSMSVVLMTMLSRPVGPGISELEFTEMEMLKGIPEHGFYDVFTLPVVDNTPRECDLTDSLRRAIDAYPKSCAVAVRNHGIYVWGESESRAKTQAECIDYLCQAYLGMRQLAINEHRQSVLLARV